VESVLIAPLFGKGRSTRSPNPVSCLRQRRPLWSSAAFGPSAGDLVLLANPRLIGKPDLERLTIDLVGRDLRQTRGKGFLKSSTAASLLA
jgi:hypothetical protein